jgi:hypothetical protein
MSWFSLSGKFTSNQTPSNITKILATGISTLTQQGNPDGMRDYLVKHKVVGHRVNARDCVLARYFTALLRENNIKGVRVAVGSGVSAHTGRVAVRVELPTAVGRLIRDFDGKHYPELDVEQHPDLDGEITKLLDSELVNA